MKAMLQGILVVLVSLTIIGCSDDSNDDGGVATPTILVGTFIDSPVEGLYYETPTRTGYTDDQGQFNYLEGEQIIFSIGNLVLGKANGNVLVTPATLLDDNGAKFSEAKSLGLAQLLQTLDNNTSDLSKITIVSNLHDLNVSHIQFDVDADLHTVLSRAEDITMRTYVLIDSDIAKTNMNKYIGLWINHYNNMQEKNPDYISRTSEYISSGTYYFTVLYDTKIIVSSNNNTVYLNDKQYVYSNIVEINASEHSLYLDSFSGGFTIYNPTYPNAYKNLEQLEANKTYYNDTWMNKYYKLIVKQDGIVVFERNGGPQRVTVFDKHLNIIPTGEDVPTRGYRLPKGEYVVSISNNYLSETLIISDVID